MVTSGVVRPASQQAVLLGGNADPGQAGRAVMVGEAERPGSRAACIIVCGIGVVDMFAFLENAGKDSEAFKCIGRLAST